MCRRIMAIVFLFALIFLGFSSPVLVKFFGADGRLVDSREFPDGAVAIPSEWSDGVVRIYSLPDTTLLATISVDPEHCGYADQAGWANVAATAMRTLGTTWADSCDSANWADQSGHSLASDSTQFAVFADSAGTATFADSTRISAFADSTRTSAYADSAGAAALAYNLVPGDGDYIQNQTSASQPASFWISGTGWIGDSFRVDGNVNIGGKLTVAGGIDPTYLALTPQSAAPGVDFALWVNAADSALVYFDGTSSVHLVTATDTVAISLFADSARVAAYADSAVFSDTALYVAGSSVVGKVDSAIFADTAFYVNTAVYADTALFVAWAESSVYSDTASFAVSADSATYADTASYVDTATYADTALYVAWAESSIYSDTASFAVNADSAVYSVYSDTAFYVNTATYADTAVYADTCLNCPRADSAVYADTALYIAGSAVVGRVDSATYADTASYVDTAIYADTAFFVFRAETTTYSDTSFYIAGANVVGKVDSAVYSDTAFFVARAETSTYSDTAWYVMGRVDSAQFADTVLGKIDSSLYSDTAAVAGDLLPGDADYIQNLTPDGVGATGQTADFDITGNGEIGGDLHIYGDLTVDGKIDPTYLALTPQVSDPAPAVAGKLWVDAGNNLVYNQSAGTSLIVVATSTGQVDASDISANSVDSSHIIDGSVGSADINWGTGAGQVDAADVPYSPAVLSDWGGVNPQYVNVALDTLAARVTSLGSGGLYDLTDGRGIRTFVYNGGAAETVEVDLFAGGGLEFAGSDSALAVEVGDFAGNGLAGSDRNLYVDVAASGALTNTGGTGSQLAVLVDGTTIGINGSNQLYIPNGAVDENLLSASVAGQGLVGGGGNPLDVNVGAGLVISNDSVKVDEANIPYTPSIPANWNGGVDPGDVDDALDSLASRLNQILAGGLLQDLVPGNGLTGGNYDGSVSRTWSVDVNPAGGLTNDFSGSGQLGINTDGYISINGSNQLQIDVSAAGDGLRGGSGSPLAVNTGYGITIASDTVRIDNIWFSGDVSVGADGSVAISNDAIDSTNIADGSISANDLGNGVVTANKLATDAVTTAKISDQSVTPAKIDSTGDYAVNNVRVKQRVTIDQTNGYALRLRIFPGTTSTPTGLTWALDGDMIIWNDTDGPDDTPGTADDNDYKICVYVGGTWQCTDVN